MAGHTNDTQNRNSLNWLAVQYVLGELPECDLFAFEERLASDSAACAAVAEATRMVMTLQAAVSDVAVMATPAVIATPKVRSARTAPRASWLVLAGATTAALGLLAAMSLGPNGSSQTQLVRADRSDSELVSLWRTGSVASESDTDDSDVELTEASSDVAVPDWLFAAVSLEQGKPAGNSTEEWQEN